MQSSRMARVRPLKASMYVHLCESYVHVFLLSCRLREGEHLSMCARGCAGESLRVGVASCWCADAREVHGMACVSVECVGLVNLFAPERVRHIAFFASIAMDHCAALSDRSFSCCW